MVVHSPLISYICSLQADLNHFSSIACLWWSFTFHGNPMKTLDAIATKKSHTHIVVKMLSKQRATVTLFYDQIYIKLAVNEAGHKSCTSFQPDQTSCMSYLVLLFQTPRDVIWQKYSLADRDFIKLHVSQKLLKLELWNLMNRLVVLSRRSD